MTVHGKAMQELAERLIAALREAGMSGVPERLSVAACHQEIHPETLVGIDALIGIFDRVTSRPDWSRAALANVPEIARHQGTEMCFFSAWDFHLQTGHPEGSQLIEFNDNGSGFLFGALVNSTFYEVGGISARDAVEPPPPFAALAEHLAAMVEREAREFFGELPQGLFLILDDAEALERGRFHDELVLLRSLLEHRGLESAIAPPEELRGDGTRLLMAGRAVSFVVNRSTDFFWQGEAFGPLRAAWQARAVYAAPNPFTYATRSDKRLLELLSRSDRDEELGILPEERAVLAAHVPETWVVREDNLDALVRRKHELVFKPAQGFAARGLLPSSQVGRSRLRRLLGKGDEYVAQRGVPKRLLPTNDMDHPALWTDLRVWAYRGKRFLLSGRASLRPDGIDLRPPGGWLATYASRTVARGGRSGSRAGR